MFKFENLSVFGIQLDTYHAYKIKQRRAFNVECPSSFEHLWHNHAKRSRFPT